MKLPIFGYLIDLEIIILICLLYLIVMINLVYSCVKVNGVKEFVMEGFEMIKKQNSIK